MPQESEAKTKVHFSARNAYLLAAFLLVAAAIIFFVQLGNNKDFPFNKNTVSGIGFPIYYPNDLPPGYKLDQKTVAVKNGILFFTLKNVDRAVNISEQAEPNQPPDLANLQKSNTSLKDVPTGAGQAILGIDPETENPIAVIVSNTTLVSITGTKSVPTDVITKLIQNMSSLPQ